MNNLTKCFAVLCAMTSSLTAQLAQAVHELPFDSKENSIELTVENTTFRIEELKIEVQNHSDWITFTAERATIHELSNGEGRVVSFGFSINKKAPVRKEEKLVFVIEGPGNEKWTKEIIVSVGPPQHFELFQNYPNPFNPWTTIGYQLPEAGRVSLKVYSILGQEVVVLFEGEREAGYHEEAWDAASVSSGTYVYRLVTQARTGKELVLLKRMVVVK